MKVCLLAPEFLPNHGGIGVYCSELVRTLRDRVEFTVLTLQRHEGGRTMTQDELEAYFDHRVEVRTLSEARDNFLFNAGFQVAVLRKLRRLLPTGSFDLIHSQHAHMPDLWSGMVHHTPPTVRTIHTTIDGQRDAIRVAQRAGAYLEPSERWQVALEPGLRLAEWLTLSRAGYTITVSDWMRQKLLARGFEPDRVTVTSPGVDTTRFRPPDGPRRELGSRPGVPIVLYSGRPTAVKGAAILARAIPRVLAEVPDAEFVFTGARREDFLPLLAAEPAAMRQVHFLGFLDFGELPAAYGGADVAVVPTAYENLPIRLLETMACGVPPVATAVCGIPEAVQSGTNGLLVPWGSAEALSEAIVRLLQDESTRRRMGRAARQTMQERYSWPRVAEVTLATYRRALDSTGS